MSFVTHAATGTWCDHCKDAWGKKNKDEWYPQAMTQALLIATSTNGQTRAYCRACLYNISQGWGKDGTQTWTLQEQMSAVSKAQIPVIRRKLQFLAAELKQRDHRLKARHMGFDVIAEEEVTHV
jgi:hypothetical protein